MTGKHIVSYGSISILLMSSELIPVIIPGNIYFTWHIPCILYHPQMLKNAGFDDVIAENRIDLVY